MRCRCRRQPSSSGGTQYYFATERGRSGYDKYRHDFAKLIWQLASPQWKFDDVTFDGTARSFDNPDHVDVGHNLPHEAPEAFASGVIEVNRY